MVARLVEKLCADGTVEPSKWSTQTRSTPSALRPRPTAHLGELHRPPNRVLTPASPAHHPTPPTPSSSASSSSSSDPPHTPALVFASAPPRRPLAIWAALVDLSPDPSSQCWSSRKPPLPLHRHLHPHCPA
jgi:hypothetical protein